jgi:nicotinamide mononucleotide (NMN) deamidase PncC
VLGDAETDLEPGDRGACEPLARFLADATAAKHRASWGVSETGASGPSGNPYGDPAGHAWVAVRRPDGAIEAGHVLTGDSDRVANMERFAARALDRLAAALRAA